MAPVDTPRIKEVRLRNYRGFSNARFILDDVSILVGRNGAGKSTLMDALSFVSEALTDSLETALERRGHLDGVRHRRGGEREKLDVSVAVVVEYGEDRRSLYGFRIGSGKTKAGYAIKQEVFDNCGIPRRFTREGTSIVSDREIDPIPDPETLFFPLVAGADTHWRSIYETLSDVSVHQFLPQAIRNEPRMGRKQRLIRDGSNAGDVLKYIKIPDKKWVETHLQAAFPGIVGVKSSARAGRRVIEFEQMADEGRTNLFDASMMSDGTARGLGILLALRQDPRPSIVLFDEIEDSLHPFAQNVMLDAIETAGAEFPVVLSTHSPEVLDHASATPDRIRIVQWSQGTSQLFHLSETVQTGLKPPQTVGRLLRANALWTESTPSTIADADFFKVD